MKMCLTCGKKVEDGKRWCSRCGHDLREYGEADAKYTGEYKKVVKFKNSSTLAFVLSLLTFIADIFVVFYSVVLIGIFVVGLFFNPVLMTPENMFLLLAVIAGPTVVIGFIVAIIVQRVLLPRINIPTLQSPSAIDRLRLRQVRRRYEKISMFCNLPVALFVIALIAVVFGAVLTVIM